MQRVTVITDPEAIRRYQLRVVISAIRLEGQGIRVNRGRRVKCIWAERFGLSPYVTDECVIRRLEQEILASEEQSREKANAKAK